mgnify:CR=1 FL=1
MILVSIKGMQMANTPYRTRRGSHPCVQYWDRAFQRGGYWLDWIVCQGGVSNEIDHVIEEFGLPELEASRGVGHVVELKDRQHALVLLGEEVAALRALGQKAVVVGAGGRDGEALAVDEDLGVAVGLARHARGAAGAGAEAGARRRAAAASLAANKRGLLTGMSSTGKTPFCLKMRNRSW